MVVSLVVDLWRKAIYTTELIRVSVKQELHDVFVLMARGNAMGSRHKVTSSIDMEEAGILTF